MTAFHKPKIFRSHSGCCICKAKSSSSRFTSSIKYEKYFAHCFKLTETRNGDVCNACVLIVKRWRNLPEKKKIAKNWNHVVDARNGPGIKNIPRFKSEHQHPEKFEKIKRKHIPKKLNISDPSISVPDFIDLSYWTRRHVCCGVIYTGQLGEVMVDARYYNKCSDSNHSFSDRSNKISSEESCHPSPQSTTVSIKTPFDDGHKMLEDATFSEYSDTDSLESKDELLEIHDTDTDEGFCDNKVR